jgi:hypothetical protein
MLLTISVNNDLHMLRFRASTLYNLFAGQHVSCFQIHYSFRKILTLDIIPKELRAVYSSHSISLIFFNIFLNFLIGIQIGLFH